MKIHYDDLFSYKFNNHKLLKGWSIHPSAKKNKLFEHLEFLGDRILGLYIAQYLFHKPFILKKKSVYMSYYCSAEVMGKIAKPLERYLVYSGSINRTILSDALEAFLAAIYIDGGPVEQIIYLLWNQVFKKNIKANAKNLLQEHMHIKSKRITYNFKEVAQGFLCVINIEGISSKARAFGQSKKLASMKAARIMLNHINV